MSLKRFLSMSASARRLDVSRPRFEKMVRAGVVPIAGYLGKDPIFEELVIMRISGDILRRHEAILAAESVPGPENKVEDGESKMA